MKIHFLHLEKDTFHMPEGDGWRSEELLYIEDLIFDMEIDEPASEEAPEWTAKALFHMRIGGKQSKK